MATSSGWWTRRVVRVVLDTNVLVSALFFGGTPERILLAGLRREIDVVTSEALLAELNRVLEDKFELPARDAHAVIELLGAVAEVVEPGIRVSVVTACDADNRVLECAAAAGADAIVTGDTRHLLPLKAFQGIPIMDPASFAALLPGEPP
jgi:putative PIN family toxin of toxin-antitoxin system